MRCGAFRVRLYLVCLQWTESLTTALEGKRSLIAVDSIQSVIG